MGDVEEAEPGYTDVTCTICGLHNRFAHMVGITEELRMCSVCVAKVGEVMDGDAGVVGPVIDWPTRWRLKRPLDP